ncbi:Bifunctional DNA primase/polymerase, N-terminal [Desulfonispora thiosulfatigenes DSM 11270]|uniref:Bifunctional DNA primase/polymerase, N-terminal n=1 Tax=Desulfonispora thiosulfatigenes DSM 11270 TaxID=656914 RepID=A0A1W1UNG9_DESTI|nr:bifunctional DNA primase/polymerase [Desulfonispora thiosulfatigenes]SMB82678.1 Bifunctional DNA primase/polymerase, N-terminal [Desulfonispora thiosulfatigenes DSM 11270]
MNQQQDKRAHYLRTYANKFHLAVVPCKEKVPKISSWQKRGVPTKEELDEWGTKYPNSNVGLVLGQASGLVGIDADGQKGIARLKEVSNGDLPDTWSFKTPGGGIRLLYRIPKGLVPKKYVESLEGEHNELALLGEGQQTIMPPSIHPNGKEYFWMKGKGPSSIEVAEAPQWMIDLMTGKKPKEQKKASQKAAKKPKEAVGVLERLAGKCPLFQESWKEQQAQGISEEDWHNWMRLLVNAGQHEAAKLFSKSSDKHDERSDARSLSLIAETDENGTGPMVRCSTFGCGEETIEGCHSTLNLNDEEITNSPGSFIRNMMDGPTLPTDPVYQPYIQALDSVDDYTIDHHGNLCSFDKKGNPFTVANFVARPTMEVIRDDGVTEDRTFRIEGVLKDAKPLPAIDVSASEFPIMSWVLKNWGIEASIRAGQNRKDLCRDAVQNMAKEVVQHRIFTHLGWCQLDDGSWVYLHSEGCIGAENITVEVEKELARYALPSEIRDAKKAAETSFSLLKIAPLDITIPLLALVYLSPLVEVLRKAGIEPNFILWLHGLTGSRKTSLSLAFLAHFGAEFISKNPPASFKDTANALEKRSFVTKDTLLLIDDYHPEASRYEAQKMAQTAQRILRMFGDRIGRGRLKSTTEFQKTYAPRGMGLVTGEDLPQGQSSVARFIGAEIKSGDVDLKMLTKIQNDGLLLSEAMVGYIKWLMPKMDDLPEILLEQFQEKREQFQKNAAHGRLGEAAAWLYLAYDLMLGYMESLDVTSSDEVKEMLGEAEDVLVSLVQKQGGQVNQERPEQIFTRILGELLSMSKVRIDPIKKSTSHYEFDSIAGEHIGWSDETFYYLLPDATYNAVVKFLASRGEAFPVKDRTLWKNLEHANMIQVEKDSEGNVHRCIKKNIPKRRANPKEKPLRPRVLHVYRNVLDSDDEGRVAQ